MSPPRIELYHFGLVVIDGKAYSKDLIVLPERVVPNWWRLEGHNLQPEDLDEVIQARPTALVVGKGTFERMQIDPRAETALKEAGIELIALPTGEAWETYNKLSLEKSVAAALHLTC